MTEPSTLVQRRLAAILAADVVGFSALMGENEEGTLTRIKSLRRDVIEPKVKEHHGRVFKTTGDGVLVEFSSPVEAVRCAVGIQEVLAVHGAPEASSALQLRIGINLGDILIEEDGDIYGDGVNVAARLEQIADPGGVFLSGKVYDEVRDKVPYKFEDKGEQILKNIARPIRAYSIAGDRDDGQTAAAKSLALPDKPSIAVLPFMNMSGDPEQEFFADGLVEDIVTSLSKLSDLVVVGRTASFMFKAQPLDPRHAAQRLSVRYVVGGSVRKIGDRLRVAAQLIDGRTGSHLWADRYDRHCEHFFDVQDDITREVTTALQVHLTEGEQIELRRRRTSNIAAWEAYVRGQTHVRAATKGDVARARQLFERALSLDHSFTAAWASLARTYLIEGRLGWAMIPETSLGLGAEAALAALAISESEADAWSALGAIRLHQRRFSEALEVGHRSVDLAPNAADHVAHLGLTLSLMGRPLEGLDLIQRAMRLSPYFPDFYLGFLSISYRLLGRLDEAIGAELRRLKRNPANAFSDLRLAALYAERGDPAAGRRHLKEALQKNPAYSVQQVWITDPIQDEGEMQRYIDLLRAVGLPG